jgi:biotin carboxyl carrier protein
MAEKGKDLLLTDGQFIQKGAKLGIIETVTKEYKITAPVSGKLRFASVAPGKAVEFGLPLFFIEG